MSGSLKIVKARMKTVGNIGKITKAMKMVAAAKLRRDTERLANGMPFCQPVIDFFGRFPEDNRPTSILIVGQAGDKGLCGGINSSVVKACRAKIATIEAAGQQAQIIIGGKVLAGLKLKHGDRVVYEIEGHTKPASNYQNAAALAHRVVQLDPERVQFIYNHCRSAISFVCTTEEGVTKKGIESIDKIALSKAIDQFSFEPDKVECWNDFHEFYYSAVIFRNMLEHITSEQSSRMTAMENASNNCKEMLDKLSIKYNRARQAKITTELCEIISGASAL